jgi:hypothetical protein
MALVRCQSCGCPEGRKGNVYSSVPHYPINHPDSGVVCVRQPASIQVSSGCLIVKRTNTTKEGESFSSLEDRRV